MILAITGLSGSGKSTIARKAANELKLHTPIQITTRPKRPGERDGIEYWFVSDETFKELEDEMYVTGIEHIKVANGETWNYAFFKNDLKKGCIIACSPGCVKSLRKDKNIVIDVMITINDALRYARMIGRKDNQSDKEKARREIDDKKIYDNYTPLLTIDNNKDLKDAIHQIKLFTNVFN